MLWRILFLALVLLPALSARAEEETTLLGHTARVAKPGAFPGDVEREWRRVLHAEKNAPSLSLRGSRLPAGDAPHWLYFAGKAAEMDEMTLLRSVNVFFNRFPSRSDKENYGVEEYWASPAEFFTRRSGDCEDYVLAKYFALRVFGVPDAKMRILLGYNVKEKQGHAMLGVYTAKGFFILDNNVRPADLIQPQAKYISRFVPLYMLNEETRWVFNAPQP